MTAGTNAASGVTSKSIATISEFGATIATSSSRNPRSNAPFLRTSRRRTPNGGR